MESYIQISKINDFLFCPRSVYLHSIYESFDKKTFHRTPQIAGTIAHKSVDKGTYSSRKKYLIGLNVYSDELELCGKIDVYDKDSKTLIERKRKLQKVYDGQKYQLYAQMACMKEMEYEINQLQIHSLTDNKRHTINLPDIHVWKKFLNVVNEMKSFNIRDAKILYGNSKCVQCIYQPLCHDL